MRPPSAALLVLAIAIAYAVGACAGDADSPAATATERSAPLESPALTDKQRSRLAIADVPVRLPAIAGVERAVMTAGPGWYAASLTLDDHTVAVHGTRVAFVEPALAAADDAAPDAITRTHGIAEVGFVEGGVAYSVEVDCQRPLDNPRCADDAYIRSLRAAMRPWHVKSEAP